MQPNLLRDFKQHQYNPNPLIDVGLVPNSRYGQNISSLGGLNKPMHQPHHHELLNSQLLHQGQNNLQSQPNNLQLNQ